MNTMNAAARLLPRRAPSRARPCRAKGFRVEAAFTLIELLVAVSISVVLAGLLVVVTRSTLDLWRTAQDRSAARVQASVALKLLASDLQSLLYRPSGEATLALDILPPASLAAHNWRAIEPLLKPDSVTVLTPGTAPAVHGHIEDSRFGRGGVWLRLIAFNRNPDGSLPQAISYQLVRRPVAGPINAEAALPIRYILFRHTATPDETFAGGYDIAAYDAPLARAGLDAALCDNVVDFGLWCYRRAPDGGLTPLYPQTPDDRSFLAQPPSENGGGNGGGGVLGGTFPDVIDVMLRVLTEGGAAQLEQMEQGRLTRPPRYADDAEWWWGHVLAHSRVYSTRLTLNRPEGL